jgi:hypothetical protein
MSQVSFLIYDTSIVCMTYNVVCWAHDIIFDMTSYHVCLTYDVVCLFPGRRLARCSNHPGIPSHAVGIWAEPFEQRVHPVGLASGEQG